MYNVGYKSFIGSQCLVFVSVNVLDLFDSPINNLVLTHTETLSPFISILSCTGNAFIFGVTVRPLYTSIKLFLGITFHCFKM